MGKVVLNVVLVLFLCAGFVNARQAQVVNPIATIKTINSEENDRFANPSSQGLPAGDLNNDGMYDFIQHTSTWEDLRDPVGQLQVVTTFLTYNENGEVIKSSFLEGVYFPAGDLDGDGITDLVFKNSSGNFEIVPVAESENDPFVLQENTTEIDTENSYPGFSDAIPAFIDDDEFPDLLLCEGEFQSFENCVIIFGKSSEDDTAFEFVEFSLSDLEIDFWNAPRIIIEESIVGDGKSIYLFGDLSSTFQGMMYELHLNESNEVEVVFEYEWVASSGEGLYDRRYFFSDFDGDGELEILSSDDRTFALAGFTRIYFNTPICDVRDIDFSGETPVIQTPEIISNNCLIDRVVEPEVTEKTVQSSNGDQTIGVWQEGNYSSCSASDLYEGCSNSTQVVDNQTIYPCEYNSCRDYYYYDTDDYYNGYANPETSTRGLTQFNYSNPLGFALGQISLIAELTRIAEIVCTQMLSILSVNQGASVIELNYRTGFTGSQNRYSCSQESDYSCSQYEDYTYYWDNYPDGQRYEDYYSYYYDNDYYNVYYTTDENGDYAHVYPYDEDLYEEYDEDLEDDEDDFEEKVFTSSVGDSVFPVSQINLASLGEFDQGFGRFAFQNIGNVDGVPGDEFLIGSNTKRIGFSNVNKAWIYRGENTTHDAPDFEIDFINDSTITDGSFLSVGGIAERLGDVNGDGINDFAVGLPFYDQRFDGVSFGAVYVFAGQDLSSPAKVTDTTSFQEPMLILRPIAEPDYILQSFGAQVTGGDFDGDGYNDIAVLADNGSNSPTSPTVRVYRGGENMDAIPDYFLYVTEEEVGGFDGDTLNSSFDAVISFMPEEVGADHQDLYYSPGAFSGYPDAVIFKGGIDQELKQKGINSPATTPAFTLAEIGPTATGSGVYLRKKPAAGDVNGDGFYDIVVEKQFDGRDGVVSSRLLIYSPNSGISISTEEELENPLEYRLSQNYPNPFNPSTTIEFNLAKATNISLTVYDLLGREVAVLIDQEQYTSGLQRVQFDASSLASGVYLYRLEAGGFTQTRKMTLIK